MKTKKKIKKAAAKKAIKKPVKRVLKAVSKKDGKPAAKKPVLVKRILKNKERAAEFERVQDLRDAVERLPDLPLPGAPVELPKDLAELNPSREPDIIPKQDIFPETAVSSKPAHKSASRVSKNKDGRHGVWIAVVSSFSVILVMWATTLGSSIMFPGRGTSKTGSDFNELRAEWEGAAQTLRDSLDSLGAKLEAAQAKDEPKPADDVLQAVGARVIFEAAQAASGTNQK